MLRRRGAARCRQKSEKYNGERETEGKIAPHFSLLEGVEYQRCARTIPPAARGVNRNFLFQISALAVKPFRVGLKRHALRRLVLAGAELRAVSCLRIGPSTGRKRKPWSTAVLPQLLIPSSNTASIAPLSIAARRSGWLGRVTDWTLPPHFLMSASVKPAAFMTEVTVNIVG